MAFESGYTAESFMMVSLSKLEKIIFYPALILGTGFNIGGLMGLFNLSMGRGELPVWMKIVVVIETLCLLTMWFQIAWPAKPRVLKTMLCVVVSFLLLRLVMLPFAAIA